MSGLLVYRAKRAVVDALNAALPDIQVEYSEPGDAERTCVFAGQATIARAEPVASLGLVTTETDIVDVWVRAYVPGDDARAAEAAVEAIAEQLVTVLAARPAIGDGLTWAGVTAGTAQAPDVAPGPEPGVTARLRLQVSVQGSLL